MRSMTFPIRGKLYLEKESSASVSRVLFRSNVVAAVPAIYLARTSPYGSSILPSIGKCRAGNPQPMVYMNLQPPDSTARRSPGGWWSLTPPSHPCPPQGQAVVFFCYILLSPIASTFGSGAPYAARTFLSHHEVPAAGRSTAFYVNFHFIPCTLATCAG